MEALRRAIAALGRKAPREKIQAWVKERFGLDLALKYISDSRSKLFSRSKRKRSKKAKAASPPAASPPAAKKAAPRPPVRPAPARPAAQPGNGQAAVRMEDLVALQELVQRVGAPQLRKLLDVLGR
jgi:hypothetical protein